MGFDGPSQRVLACRGAKTLACHILRNPENPESNVPEGYVESVYRAIDYIVRNLGGDLCLENVAMAACFSPFHFHRVFRSLLGETLNQFIKRLRLERALQLMSHGTPRPLTEIALDCGFSSSSDFSRSFKQSFGEPPSSFDLETFRNSRRQDFEAAVASQTDGPHLPRLPKGENPDGFEVHLRSLPARTVAYTRVLDPYRKDAVTGAYASMLEWAEARGLADCQWLGYMWEDPEIVAIKDCRYDVAIVVDDYDFHVEGEIGRYEFPPMRVAELTMRGGIDMEQRALDWIFGTWLPRSGYVPDDQPCFEAWIGRPFAHGVEHFELHCHLPVKPA